MKHLPIFVALAALAASTFAIADDAKSHIQARYREVEAAFNKHDGRIMDRILTADFESELPDGTKRTRVQTVTEFQGLMAAASNVSWERKITKLTHSKAGDVATVSSHFTGTMTGPDKKPHNLEFDSNSIDIWAKTEKGWQIRRSKLLKVSMKQDGKPVPFR